MKKLQWKDMIWAFLKLHIITLNFVKHYLENLILTINSYIAKHQIADSLTDSHSLTTVLAWLNF